MPWAGVSLRSSALLVQHLCSRRAVAPQHSVQLKGQREPFFRPFFPGRSLQPALWMLFFHRTPWSSI